MHTRNGYTRSHGIFRPMKMHAVSWYRKPFANSDHAAADVRVLYDSEKNVIKDTYPIYHKQ